jgi:hypothetical protein
MSPGLDIREHLEQVARGNDMRSKITALRMLQELDLIERPERDVQFVQVQILGDGTVTPPLPPDFDEREYELAWMPTAAEPEPDEGGDVPFSDALAQADE